MGFSDRRPNGSWNDMSLRDCITTGITQLHTRASSNLDTSAICSLQKYTAKVRKGKEEYLYSAFLTKVVHSKCSGMDHTVLPANNTMPAFPS